MNQARGVVRGDQAVGVERDEKVGVGHVQAGVARRRRLQVQPVRARNLAEAAPQQRDVAVEVHRLVRRVREIDVTLALEACQLDAQQIIQAAVFAQDARLVQVPGLGAAFKFVGAAPVRVTRCYKDQPYQQRRGMVRRRMVLRLRVEPGRRFAVQVREPQPLRAAVNAAGVPVLEEGAVFRGEPCCLRTQQPVEFLRQGAYARQPRGVFGRGRIGRVVDEQHHAPAGVVLQRRAQQRVPHHVGLFLIRRHEDGQRRRGVRVEAALDLLGVGGGVACAALKVAEARQLIDHAAVD